MIITYGKRISNPKPENYIEDMKKGENMSEIQWFSYIIFFIGFSFEFRWLVRNKKYYLLSIPWLILLLHNIAFYSAILIHPGNEVLTDNIFFAMWSSILRGHAALTIVGYILYKKNQKTKKE